MKPLAALLLALAAAFAAHAQTPAPAASEAVAPAVDEAAERARIHAEKEAAEKQLKEAQVACRARFAVTGCVKDATREYNNTLAELRRQERVLSEADRRRRAAAHQKDLDERTSPERRAEADRKRAEALAEQRKREANAAEKAAKKEADDAKKAAQPPHVKPAPSHHPGPQGTPRAVKEPKAHGPTPEEAARNRAAYEERLAAAQRHLAETNARIARRGKPAASALPEPK